MGTIPLNIEFWPKQAMAFETEATEVLFGGATRGGKSHFLRHSLIVWCLQIPQLQCTLIRKKYDDILENHVYGKNGFKDILAPLIAAKQATVTQHAVTFANGSRIVFKHCFTGDTKVLTTEGPKTLKDLTNESGYVSIAPGVNAPFRSVRKTRTNAQIVRVLFDDGSSYRCTPDHEFLTSSGFVQAQYLVGKECLTNKFPLSATQSKSLTERNTGSLINKNISVGGRKDCIESFGNFITERSHPLTKSIIEMATCLIIKLGISNCWNVPLIGLCTPAPQNLKLRQELISKRGRSLQNFGTEAIRGMSGTSNTTSKSSTCFTLKLRNLADSARKYTKRGILGSIAATTAGKLNTEKRIDFKLPLFAQFVTSTTRLISIALRKRAVTSAAVSYKPKRCVSVTPAGNEDVYCLTVPDYGFFPLANGVLVSNCQDERQFESAQGVPSNVLAIDEATQIPERLIKTFRAWCTMPEEMKANLPAELKGKFPRIYYFANPIGTSLGYFRRHFVKARPKFSIEAADGFKRQFIPAFVRDNPSEDEIAAKGRVMGMHDAATAKALIEGDWDAPLGDFFPEWDENRHVVPDFVPPAHWYRYRTFDWGSADPFCCYWFAISDGDLFEADIWQLKAGAYVKERKRLWFPRGAKIIYREWYGCQQEDPAKGLGLRNADIARGIIERSPANEERSLITLTDSYPFPDRGESEGQTIAKTFADNGCPLVLGNTARVTGWAACRDALIGKVIDLETQTRYPLTYVQEGCKYLREYIPALPRHPNEAKRHEDAAESGEATHSCDAWRIGEMAIAPVREKPTAQVTKVMAQIASAVTPPTFDDAIKMVKQQKARRGGKQF